MQATASPARGGFRKRWIIWALLGVLLGTGIWHTHKPMPPGTHISTPAMAASNTEFLFDLSFNDPRGHPVRQQEIFDAVFAIIDEAQSFIVADFFLLNDQMGAASAVHRRLSHEFAARLLARKAARPDINILLITDPINETYGGTNSALFDKLRAGGVSVVNTNLDGLRDSNPAYSAVWRVFLQWWGNSPDGGALLNPFDTDAPGITLRSWLALLNFKANHRKVIVADRSDSTLTALVTSANPHDASSAHSNVALRFSGELARQLVDSELAIARDAGWRGHIYAPAAIDPLGSQGDVRLSYLTEGAIREHLVQAIAATRNGDGIDIATFYLSERSIVEALLAAAARGAHIRLLLDANRDAFGRQKDGVPNRPVANELVTRGAGKIEVRWYRTHGEQFHTKLALIRQGERMIASLGSANLTRRNIGDYNLEANVALAAPLQSAVAGEMRGYFDRLWNNTGPAGTQYSAPFGTWQDTSASAYWRYRLMEATGLSTF